MQQNWQNFKIGFKDYFKTNYKDWKWWYKLCGFLLGLIGLILTLISGLVHIQSEMYFDFEKNVEVPKWLIEGVNGPIWDYDANLLMYFSYFTNQTNFFVLIWFIMALIRPKNEGKGKVLGFNGSLLIATYISITAIIWTFMLFPASLVDGSPRPVEEWISNVLLHIIVPVMFVLYVILWMHKEQLVKTSTWLKKSWMILIYILIYGIVMLLRGEARYQAGFNGPSSYPYFFLELHSPLIGMPGWAWFIIALIAIIAIAIGFSTLYVWSINYHHDKMNRKAYIDNSNSGSNNSGPVNSSEPNSNLDSQNKTEIEKTDDKINEIVES